ncbi:MAG TPA: PLP-dependent aminotransferase family protein [Oculatellaceae cyanobacterium]
MFAPEHVDVCTDPLVSEKLLLSQKQIKQMVIGEITSGRIAPGEKVPSIRVLSSELGISPAVVRRVFSQLLAEGWLEMRHGSGTYVSDSARFLLVGNDAHSPGSLAQSGSAAKHSGIPGIPAAAATAATQSDADAAADAGSGPCLVPTLWDTGLQSTFDGGFIHGLSASNCDASFLPTSRSFELPRGARWSAALDRWKEDCSKAPGLTDPAGMLELREQIAEWLRRAKGIVCTAGDIVVVNGAQEARNLISRLLVDPGTKVAYEEPGSVSHRLLFQSYGARIVPVSVDDSGLVLDELLSTPDAQQADILFVTPVAQFPTGAVFSRSRKQKIAEWANERRVVVVEDDSASEFLYESRVSLSIYSQASEQTVYIGSFSQMLPSEWQIGFVVAPACLRKALIRVKSLTNRCTSLLVQSLVRRLLESGFVQEYTRRLQRQNDERRQFLLEILRTWHLENAMFSPVKGGSWQTLWLQPGIDDISVARACAESGIAIAPVSPCFVRQPARSGLILNFSAMDVDSLISALSRLRGVLKETLI